MDGESKFPKPDEAVAGSSSAPEGQENTPEMQEAVANLPKIAAAIRKSAASYQEGAAQAADPTRYRADTSIDFIAAKYEQAVVVIRDVDATTSPIFVGTLFSLYGPLTRVVMLRDPPTATDYTFFIFFAGEKAAKAAFDDFRDRYDMQFGVGKSLATRQEMLRLELYDAARTFALTEDGVVEVRTTITDEQMVAILQRQKMD